jgi:hypothetical protein
LYRDAATLQRKWDVLTLSAERGGVGIAFSTEQAREAVRKFPPLLGFSVETYKTGWSMLTNKTDGLGQPHEEARACILRGPQILSQDIDKVVRRFALLKSLGYEEAGKMVLREPRVLTYKEETVKEAAAWWKRTGLDHVKIVTAYPHLLGLCSVKEMQAKLDFLSEARGGHERQGLEQGVFAIYTQLGRPVAAALLLRPPEAAARQALRHQLIDASVGRRLCGHDAGWNVKRPRHGC